MPEQNNTRKDMTRGDKIYLDLMDLDLILQDSEKMVMLKMFLASVDESSPQLDRFHAEVIRFKERIELIIAAISSDVLKG